MTIETRQRFWWQSNWGRRLAGGYILLVAAVAGYITYRLLFAAGRSPAIGSVMVTLGFPWSRTLGALLGSNSTPAIWLILVGSFALNAAMLCFIGSRLEQLARGN
jgi:hypothetical protein